MGDKVSVALSLILEIIPLINVLLVDDHELVRAGIRRILGNDSNLMIVFYVQIMPDDLVMQLHRF
ncbi:hypothetical protein CI649_22935 [Klebsiella pneumoniae subsp. pneumoniae]|nr:hypothetical protein CI624_19765 [Klebsiella pneumoniae subsp. pneumoniae]OYF03178.1 hypothetical protein CI625_06620 [Klebsiella pneumoniae subsp. pneumoniae]OYF25566.1 hypothetical protein CI623_11770 [Klebsiella pneumoniae subsp. pneumoniae]OYG02236.1 hypothetical protein CI649_22935 [Klebsiella pneumoniae subsp. pneumoniae]OYG19788.1 hypothetical protein CI647_28040 [Klebsiella pneumoniae subsp. pneumoniae]